MPFQFKDFEKYIRANAEKREKELAKKKEEAQAPLSFKPQPIHLTKEEKDRVAVITSMNTPIDFQNAFSNDETSSNVHADSISDAFVICLNTLGRVDIEYISKISGYSLQDVIFELKGSAIYQNPDTWDEVFYKGWETKEEYLCGNLATKLKAAKIANEKYLGYFADNIKAIEELSKSLPIITNSDDLYVALGSPWLPEDVVKDFISFLLGDRNAEVIHDPVSASWNIHLGYQNQIRNTVTYGTSKISAAHIIENTLNQTNIVACDSVYNPLTKKKEAVKNEKETLAALEKQKLIIERFNSWIFSNEERKQRLINIYNNKYCQNFTRIYDGSFLTFPDMNKSKIKLEQFQKNAIARIIFSNNVLLAHDTGSGKTYEMIAGGHELKRMGLSKKNLYVVPNNIVHQWKKMYLDLYPQAELLVIDPKKFTKEKRNEILNQIIYFDYDAIIMAQSSFEMIPISPEYRKDILRDEKKENDEAYSNSNTKTSLVKRKHTDYAKGKLEREFIKLGDNDPNTIYFDQLEIDRLFVDESHNYKNVPLDTNIKVYGISTNGSAKCQDMLDKVSYTQRRNNGKGVVFATATPITNSISDIYVVQLYLQAATLKLRGFDNFTAWIANYAKKEQNFEIDVDTTKYRIVERYSTFNNLPELANDLAMVADFHHMDDNDGLPSDVQKKVISVKPNDDFKKYLIDLSARADLIRARKPRVIREGATNEEKVMDNMLLITHDGRNAALDLRILNEEKYGFDIDGKINKCAHEIIKVYKETQDTLGTQLVFCDSSTPKIDKFNVYDELKNRLVALGMPSNQIEFIHNATTDAQRDKLFSKMNAGEIRVLVGSTFKLGLGVNVQDRCVALHHIDVPWRPADLVQREGRIVRQGNRNKSVFIYRYVTDSSFDAYSWQLLETKQKFITKLLNNKVFDRSGSDLDDCVLDYGEVKALAIGDNRIKARVELYNEVQRLKLLEAQYLERVHKLGLVKSDLAASFTHIKDNIIKAESDYEYICSKVNLPTFEKGELKEYGDKLYTNLFQTIESRKAEKIGEYGNFSIITPEYQTSMSDKLYLFIVRDGKYKIEVEKNGTGIAMRIRNFIDKFGDYLQQLKDDFETKKIKYNEIVDELAKTNPYIDAITTKSHELNELDVSLGIVTNKI